MLNEALISAYRFHKGNLVAHYRPTRHGLKSIPTRFAESALSRAYGDMAAGLARFPAERIWPAVSWQPVDETLPASSRRERLGHVANPAAAGLRFIGRVLGGCGGRNGYWDTRDMSGWCTEPHGDILKDGTGLCFGVVYQLPGRKGRARFVAGYEFGGTDGGPTLDFGSIYESAEAMGDCYSDDARSYDAALSAARAADTMAKQAAETECEYRTAWEAGTRYAETQNELETARADFYRLNRERRAVIKVAPASFRLSESCRVITRELQRLANAVTEARIAMRDMAKGDYAGLLFHPDERLKAAFCEGADIDAYPA